MRRIPLHLHFESCITDDLTLAKISEARHWLMHRGYQQELDWDFHVTVYPDTTRDSRACFYFHDRELAIEFRLRFT